jgi:hypothetical protein
MDMSNDVKRVSKSLRIDPKVWLDFKILATKMEKTIGELLEPLMKAELEKHR